MANDMDTTEQTRADEVRAFIARTPLAQEMGLRCEVMGDEMTMIMPYQEKLIGNVAIRALHGGAIGAFLEITVMAQVFLQTDIETLPKPIDLTIDYLRSGREADTFARAIIRKQGSRMTSVHAEAWQSDISKPVAALRAQFLMSPAGEAQPAEKSES